VTWDYGRDRAARSSGSARRGTHRGQWVAKCLQAEGILGVRAGMLLGQGRQGREDAGAAVGKMASTIL